MIITLWMSRCTCNVMLYVLIYRVTLLFYDFAQELGNNMSCKLSGNNWLRFKRAAANRVKTGIVWTLSITLQRLTWAQHGAGGNAVAKCNREYRDEMLTFFKWAAALLLCVCANTKLHKVKKNKNNTSLDKLDLGKRECSRQQKSSTNV